MFTTVAPRPVIANTVRVIALHSQRSPARYGRIQMESTMVAIKKGTLVRVRTTNGGEVVASLLDNYRKTYDVVIDINGACVVICPTRIKSVEPV
jgi:hypothetical protein